ncbi:Protein of unknown function [Lampropedia hyalina DSM 16112]|jgi:hypothetical protein|uniref:DUF2946 domain-containing protein n=1 Tax=Lampropedia hyalina DSM 16112 TaxID=1122156 RepID=A0A1M4W329_9BURK|nr:DUF2946 family protein [Lampropedia hyalina]SHE75704.1 Protein of unknown function [Lampropedia hyalina DSM 16112]
MDEIVKQAMAKWPNVPDCYGWLGLDARGHWYMRDDATQAQGDFAHSKGSRLLHDGLIAFIGRNYTADDQGRWYFQNGPQRVYVELESTPWIWRIQDDGTILSHTGQSVTVQGSLLDELGRVYLHTPLGLGLVHSQDIYAFSRLQEQQPDNALWQPREVPAHALPAQFGYVPSPQALNRNESLNGR